MSRPRIITKERDGQAKAAALNVFTRDGATESLSLMEGGCLLPEIHALT